MVGRTAAPNASEESIPQGSTALRTIQRALDSIRLGDTVISIKCHECQKEVTSFTDVDEHYICSSCATKQEEKAMKRDGKAILYLDESKPGWRAINWSGSLSFRIDYHRRGKHNIAKTRTDVWFTAFGENWWGVNYGENTQVLHCRRIQ